MIKSKRFNMLTACALVTLLILAATVPALAAPNGPTDLPPPPPDDPPPVGNSVAGTFMVVHAGVWSQTISVPLFITF